MAYPIKDVPENCVCPAIRGQRGCIECYYSQVNEITGAWTGSAYCWNAGCLALDVDRLSDSQKAAMHLEGR